MSFKLKEGSLEKDMFKKDFWIYYFRRRSFYGIFFKSLFEVFSPYEKNLPKFSKYFVLLKENLPKFYYKEENLESSF